jgi:hypothetical protein
MDVLDILKLIMNVGITHYGLGTRPIYIENNKGSFHRNQE